MAHARAWSASRDVLDNGMHNVAIEIRFAAFLVRPITFRCMHLYLCRSGLREREGRWALLSGRGSRRGWRDVLQRAVRPHEGPTPRATPHSRVGRSHSRYLSRQAWQPMPLLLRRESRMYPKYSVQALSAASRGRVTATLRGRCVCQLQKTPHNGGGGE